MPTELVVDCVTGEATENEAAALPAPVPASVTPRQARLALAGANLLDDVETAIDGMGQAARIEWDYALEIRRDSPLVAALAPILGLSDETIDAMFTQAAGM